MDWIYFSSDSDLPRNALEALDYLKEVLFYLNIPEGLIATVGRLLFLLMKMFFSMQWLSTSLETMSNIIFSLLKIIAFLMAFIFLILLARRTFKKEGMVILPFETFADEKGIKTNGKAVSDLLKVELQRILQVHSLKFESLTVATEELIIPRLIPTSETLEFSISEVGNIGTGPTALSLGRLIIVFKRLCPGTDPLPIITGSIEKYGSVMKLTACLEGRETHVWEATWKIKEDNPKPEEHIPTLIRFLSFKIAHELAIKTPKQNVSAKTWRGLMNLTDSMEAYHLYTLTGATKYLERSRMSSIKAAYSEKFYEKAVDMLSSLGFIYAERGNYCKALKIFLHVIKFKSDLGNLGMGVVYGRQSNWEGALKAFEEVLKINPKFAEAWSNKGGALINLGRSPEALEASEEAIKLNPRISAAWSNKSGALVNLGRSQEALEASEEALRLNLEFASAWCNKSGALVNLDRFQEALEASEEALRLNPKFAAAWCNKGAALAGLRIFDEALKAYEEALKIDLRYAKAWSNISGALVNLGRFQEALEASKEALKLDPKISMAWNNKGAALAGLHMFDEALKAYDEALKIDPRLGIALINNEIALNAVGRNKDAEALFSQAKDNQL